MAAIKRVGGGWEGGSSCREWLLDRGREEALYKGAPAACGCQTEGGGWMLFMG